MKKLLLIFSAACLLPFSQALSQCIPNNDTIAGIEPDTLAITNVNVPYNEVIYFHLPGDTIVDFVIGQDTIPVHLCIDSLTIDSVHGLPDGFSYGCSVPWCSVLGNGNGCAAISGTATESQVGIYPLDVFVTIYTNDCYGFELPPTVDTVTFYYLNIQFATGQQNILSNEFSIGKCYPNPASSETTIPFYLNKEGEVTISVLNSEGKLMFEKNMLANSGVHREEIDVSTLPSSLYYIQIKSGAATLFTPLQLIK